MRRLTSLLSLLLLLLSAPALAQQEWREMEYADLNGVRIAYDEVGSGEPILFVHGGQVADSFLPMLSEPSLEGYRRISMHVRGNGQSGDSEEPFTYQVAAADGLELLRHLGISEAHVVAHSSSGRVALYMAMAAPDLVQSLVLLEGRAPDVEGLSRMDRREQYAEDNPDADDLEGPFAAERPDRTREDRAAFWLEMTLGPEWQDVIADVYPHAQEHLIRAYGRTRPGDGQRDPSITNPRVAEADYANIGSPIMYIASEAMHPAMQTVIDFLKERFPDTIVEVAGETHMLQVLHPAAAAQTIRDFVSQHPID